jgi:hypothetical protein
MYGRLTATIGLSPESGAAVTAARQEADPTNGFVT